MVATAGRVLDVMITRPKTVPADAVVGDVHAQLSDDHVHLLLLVRDGRLVGTVVPREVPAGVDPATALLDFASSGHTVGPDDPLAEVHPRLLAAGIRRLAVVGEDGRLMGLLCLKRDGSGYCTDEGVASRAAERAAG